MFLFQTRKNQSSSRRASGVRRPIRQPIPVGLERLEDRTVPSTVNWIAGSGNWDNPANWSTGSIPGSGDDAVISTQSAATITVVPGDVLSVKSVSTDGPDTLAILQGGSLSVAADSTLSGLLDNSGQIAVNGGTLQLVGGGRSTGSIGVAGGAEILFADGSHRYDFVSGAEVSGAGTVQLGANSWANFGSGTTYAVSGTTNIVAGTLVLDGSGSMGTLNESGGELDGSAAVIVTGTTTWTDGTMSGPGSTDAKGGLTLGMPNDTTDRGEILAGRTLISEASGIWYANDQLTQQESSTFENSGTATLTIDGGNWGSEGSTADGIGTLDNQGKLIVDNGPGTTLVQSFFSNEGNVTVTSGILDLGNGGTATGSFSAAAGATLAMGFNFNYASYTFGSGSSVSGAGTIDFGSGVAASFAAGGTYDVTGATTINTGGNTNSNVVFSAGCTVAAVGDLTIDTGVVNFSTGGTITVASLNQSGGTLTGSDSVVVSGLTIWTDGNMSGTGSTTAAGGIRFGLSDGTGHFEQLEARTFVNVGQATWIGGGEIDLFAGSTFINQVGATFSEQTDGTIWTDNSVGQLPSGTFDNQGRITVSSNGTAGMCAFFYNSGSVEIQAGTWVLVGNGTASGSFVVDSGAAINLNGFYNGGDDTKIPPVNLSGAGTATFNSGMQILPALVTGGDVVIPVPPPGSADLFEVQGNVTVNSLTMSNGYLIVYGTLTVTGPMNWTGGYIVGPGKIVAEGGLNIGDSLGDGGDLYGATLVNAGTATLNNQSSIGVGFGSTIVNEQNATLSIGGGGSGGLFDDGTSFLYNQGTITADVGASFTASIQYLTLVNSGRIEVKSGTLSLEGYGTATGNFIVDAGSTLEFGQSQWYFNSGSSVSGAGTVEFPFDYYSTTFNSGSTYNVSGMTDVQVTVMFANGSSVENTGVLTIDDAGSANFSSGNPVSVASLNLQGGALTGSDTVTVSGQTTWVDGIMSGPGTTVAEGSLQIGSGDANDAEYLSVRTLINSSTATVEENNNFIESYNGTFENLSAATLTILSNVDWEASTDGTGDIVNQGTIIVPAGTKAETAPPDLINTGSVQVQQGTLTLGDGGSVGGTYTIDAGANLTDDADAITPSSVTFPRDFITGGWAAIFSGTASGAGLASVGVSLFDGTNYFDGTAFESSTPVFLPATLNGTNWTFIIQVSDFSTDVSYTVGSQALDNADDVEPSSITALVLRQLPVVSVSMTAPANGSETNNNKPTLSAMVTDSNGGNDVASVQFQYSGDGGTTWTNAGAAQTSGPFSFRFPTALADGSYEARAIATDDEGTGTTSTAVSFTIDTVAPTVSMTAPANGTVSNNNEPTLSANASDNTSGTGLAGVQFQYSSDGGSHWNNAGAAESSGPFSFTFTTALGMGPMKPVPSPRTTRATARHRPPFPSPSTPWLQPCR